MAAAVCDQIDDRWYLAKKKVFESMAARDVNLLVPRQKRDEPKYALVESRVSFTRFVSSINISSSCCLNTIVSHHKYCKKCICATLCRNTRLSVTSTQS